MGIRDTGLDPHGRARRKNRRSILVSKSRVLLIILFIIVAATAWYLGTLITIARAKKGGLMELTESRSHDIGHLFVRRQSAAAKAGEAGDGLPGGLVDITILDTDDVRISKLDAQRHHALDEDVRGLEEEILHMNAGAGQQQRTHTSAGLEQQGSGRQAGEGVVDGDAARGTEENQPGENAWKHPLRGPDEGLTCEAWLEEADGMVGGRDFSEQPIRVRDGQVSRQNMGR